MFPNSYTFNPGVVLDPVTMTPMIGGSSIKVNPFGVQAKPQQKVWQKMFIKDIPLECSNQNMLKLLNEFGDAKNYKRALNSRGQLLPFCYFDLETAEEILRLKRLFKNIRILDKVLQLRISQQTQSFIKEWTTIQKDEWRKKLLTPQMNEAKEYATLEEYYEKDDPRYKSRVEEKLKQINIEVKKIAFERMREQQKKQHVKQKQREKKKKRQAEELQRNFHQQEDYWLTRQRAKQKERRKEKQKERQREKAKLRRLQRQIDLDPEEQERRISKFINPERIKMIDKEEQEDLLALEEENPPLPDEQTPQLQEKQEKKIKFIVEEAQPMDQQIVDEVLVEMPAENEQQMIQQRARVNQMFDGWDKDEEKAEEKPALQLKLPEMHEQDQEKQKQNRIKIKQLQEQVPKNKRDLWEYPIDWELLSKSVVLIKNIRPWLQQQSQEYMGSVQQKFVALVEKKIFSRSHPDKIIKIISQLIDEDAEEFVIKLWKTLVLQYLKLKNGLE